MLERAKLSERFVQYIWENQYFRPDALRLTNGYSIDILNVGEFNEDDGPDFLNAEILFDNEIFARGDIEIHLKATDWLTHGHHKDPAYNDVILHVIMWDDGYLPEIRKQNGKFLPTLILTDFLDRPIGKLMQYIRNKIRRDQTRWYPCQKNFMQVNLQRLEKAGQRRFIDKVFYFETTADNKGWDQTLYEGIMTAMGYSKNKWQFEELAKKLPISQLRKLEDLISIQAIFFGTAGLLPFQTQRHYPEGSETASYIKKLESVWKRIRKDFDIAVMSNRQWIFSGQRPINFPTVRIGQASIFISRFYKNGLFDEFYKIFIDLIDVPKPIKQLYNKLSLFFIADSEDFWATHYTFWGKRHNSVKNLIGKQRLKAIVLNILLPLFYAYSQSSGNRELRELIWELYNTHTSLGKNRITKYQSKILQLDPKLIKSACLEQGMIYVYQDTCFQKLCSGCILAQK